MKKIDLTKYLAKSSGEDIISHTDKVIANIKKLAIRFNLSEKDTNLLVISGILHDIGKLTKNTQKYFKNGVKTKFKYPHNILGWAFIVKYLKHRHKDKISNLVLWHHANYNSCDDLDVKLLDISKGMSSDELDLMREFCNHYNIQLNDYEEEEISSDNEFYRLDNLLRCILITADVCASSNTSVDNLFTKEDIDLSLIDDNILNSDRTKEQIQIVNNIVEHSTTLIKGPTGFGKSIIGLLFAMVRNKQVIWVCPTNVISDSIYEDVIRNLKMLNINMSVELYITGERKKANNVLGDFISDIIITNVDNYIKPTISNSYGNRSLMIYECDVIFDESHEYESMDCALFSAYNNIMDKRHNSLNSTTLMLTASQPTFRFKNLNGKPITILPNEDEHYKAVHSEEYSLVFHDDIPTHLMEGEFVSFTHTVDDVQKYYTEYDGPKLICHGRYLDEDKDSRKKMVLDNYGKDGPRVEYGVFTNQMLTTSCDYSVSKLFVKCPTLKIFQQVMGRINRWGGMTECVVHISLNKSRADRTVIGSNDENILQELFISELRERFEGVKFTLDEMYVFFNEFNKRHVELVNSISRQNLVVSKNMLKNIFPKKIKINNKDIKIANSNKLRKSTSADELYITVEADDSNERVTISINVSRIVGFTRQFNEDEKTYFNQLKVIKLRDNYNKHRKLTPELIKNDAIFYGTPYPVFNYVYNTELGLIKK